MNDNPAPEAEAELEAFRQRWREEVSARNKRPETPRDSQTARGQRRPSTHASNAPPTGPSTTRRKEEALYSEDIAPNAYHDLPNKEDYLKLGTEGQNHDRMSIFKEPTSALEHYERAVEKEGHGMLGDSLAHYRKAFKLDDQVDKAYKNKHFPPSAFKKPTATKPAQQQPNPSNAPVTIPNPAHHSLQGSSNTVPSSSLSPNLQHLVDDFSALRIEPTPPPTDASPQPPCPIAELPEEILTHILSDLALLDVTAFARTAQVCKRLAYLVLTEESIWKRVALGSEVGFGGMHYDYVCDIEGFALDANAEIARYLGSYDDDDLLPAEDTNDAQTRALAFTTHTQHLLHSTYQSSWRQLFRSRPRIRFNGCYISTVNYTRPGATGGNTLTWGAPVHVVTYFRYLRFFRDGSVISLLTTTEPADVVHHLTKENIHNHHTSSFLPSSVMKDALRGRWLLSGPLSSSSSPAHNSSQHDLEAEGDIHIETLGVVPKYTYKMQLALAHAGKGARNNKLAWKGFWSYNKLTDDWGEFGLRNDRAFYWSRVRSYV